MAEDLPSTSPAAPPEVAPAGSTGLLRRWLPRLGVAAIALAAAALVWSCFGHDDRSVYSAPIARLASASAGVTYLPRGHLYIIAQPDGSLLALDEVLPAPPAGADTCAVQWRPDLAGGVFQARPECGAAAFTRDGTAQGGGAPLLHHALRLSGKNAIVDLRRCTPALGGAARSCAALRAGGGS
ncbi:MAG TPA: hypothetical protein VKV26_07200 [Dehalococcoidia bacterium]|nr:hypothetical protein [Dehalococcoidia bacterium]